MGESANGQSQRPGPGGSGGPGDGAVGNGQPRSAAGVNGPGGPPPQGPGRLRGGHYKWLALSNTTIGILAATVNGSIVIISLPAIYRGIQLDPLTPVNVS